MGYCGSDAWRRDFIAAHGREPTGEDLQDCIWSERFAAQHGRPPTQREWELHWYEKMGLTPPEELAELAEDMGEEEPAAEIWPFLELPTPAAAPPLLRDVWRYFTELLTRNPTMVIPPPFHYEKEWEELDEAGQRQRERMEELARLLGLRGGMEAEAAARRAAEAGIPWPYEEMGIKELEEAEEARTGGGVPTEKPEWEQFFRAMAVATPEAQQYLAGLRYTPEQGWYFEPVGLLPHLEHL